MSEFEWMIIGVAHNVLNHLDLFAVLFLTISMATIDLYENKGLFPLQQISKRTMILEGSPALRNFSLQSRTNSAA